MILNNDKKSEQLRLDEKTNVEEPLLDQLEAQGWQVIRLAQVQQPSESFRQSFAQVLLVPKLEEALCKINPFLEDDQVAECVQRITTFQQSTLIENNQKVLRLLLENTSVAENRKTGEKVPLCVMWISVNPVSKIIPSLLSRSSKSAFLGRKTTLFQISPCF